MALKKNDGAYISIIENVSKSSFIDGISVARINASVSQYNVYVNAHEDQGAKNLTAANAVVSKINAIGTVEYTDASKAKIEEARAAYETLTNDQKALITNYETLTAAETTYANLAPHPVTGVTLDKTDIQTVNIGDKIAFTATVSPEDATDKTVVWSVGGTNVGTLKLYSNEECTTEIGSDATEKLTVYAKGEVPGTATVTVTTNDGNKTANCDVTVNKVIPTIETNPTAS